MNKTKTFLVTFDYQGVNDIDCSLLDKMLDYSMEYGYLPQNVDIFNIEIAESVDE